MKLSLITATALTTLLPVLTSALSPIHTRNDAFNSSHSAWVYPTVYGNITFVVTAVKDVGDLYFHIEAPAMNSWVAVGTGSGMKGSVMWVAYRSQDEKGVTLSPRTVDKNVEPSYSPSITCNLIARDGVTNGIVRHNDRDIYSINGYCKDINGKTSQKAKRHGRDSAENTDNSLLSFSNAEQNFIFALGPTDRHLHSDSKSADIRRHSMYGHFKIDLTKSTVDSTDDVSYEELSAVGTWENHGATLVGDLTKDRDWSGNMHSLLMCGTYVLVFPVGVVFLRLLEKVKWHAWMQGVGTGFVVVGVGLGIWAGLEYNHSKNFNSPHQLLGITVVGLTLLQLGLGIIHHVLYKKHQRPTIMGRIHLYLGPLLLIAGAANGFLGFHFSGGSYHNIMYGVFVGIFFVGLLGALWWARKRRQSRSRERERVGDEAYEEFKRGDVYRGRPLDEQEGYGIPLREVPNEPPPEYEEGRRAEPRTLV